MKSVLLRTLLGVAALMWAAIASATETMRYERPLSGPLISSSEAYAPTLSVAFKLGEFNAHNGGHLVIGRGDLQRYYNEGKAPLGSGVIVGEATTCNAPGQVSMLMEDWTGTAGVMDRATCYNGIDKDAEYSVDVTQFGYTLKKAGVVVAKVTRAPTQPDTRGIFIFGASSSTPYELRAVRLLQ